MKKSLLKSVIKGVSVLLPVVILSFFISGCANLSINRIHYNQEKEYYEYPVLGNPPIPLRNNSGELVTKENFESFLTELSALNFRYPFDERMEQAVLLKQSDFELASLYAKSVDAIQQENYGLADRIMDNLRSEYPQIAQYSDLAFLEGFALEKRGEVNLAERKYEEFLAFSAKKYSERFRGYRYADAGDFLWQQQRNYASDFLEGQHPNAEQVYFRQITPKFYHNSLQPGYLLNEESLVEQARGILALSLGTGHFSGFAAGAQYYRNLFSFMDFNPSFYYSKNSWELKMALPLQVYKSDNNRLGLKTSPFASYNHIKKYKVNNVTRELNESVFNYGVKTSAGFYLVQQLSLGAYYTFHYYNEDRPFSSVSQPFHLWWTNEYDVSIYYNLIKNLSLKAGMKSGDWVAGLYLPGWEISYNINERNIILRTEMY
jgi:hypothetical protein